MTGSAVPGALPGASVPVRATELAVPTSGVSHRRQASLSASLSTWLPNDGSLVYANTAASEDACKGATIALTLSRS